MKLRIAGNYREHPQRASHNSHEKPFRIKTRPPQFPRQLPPNHRMKQSLHHPTIPKIVNEFPARKKLILSMFSNTFIPNCKPSPTTKNSGKNRSINRRMENNQKTEDKLNRTNLHPNSAIPACSCRRSKIHCAGRHSPALSVFLLWHGRNRFSSLRSNFPSAAVAKL